MYLAALQIYNHEMMIKQHRSCVTGKINVFALAQLKFGNQSRQKNWKPGEQGLIVQLQMQFSTLHYSSFIKRAKPHVPIYL